MPRHHLLLAVAVVFFSSISRVFAPPVPPLPPPTASCNAAYRQIADPKQAFLHFVTSTENQNEGFIALLKKGDAKLKSLGRAENPVIKEANDEVLKDQALVDALENWWRDLWLEELRQEPELWSKISTGENGEPLIYSGYKEVVVPFSESSDALAQKWEDAHVRATLRYYEEVSSYLGKNLPLAAKLAKARELLRDPRRQHTSSFVRRESDLPMLALATALNREGRGAKPGPDGVPRPLRDDAEGLAALEKRFTQFKDLRAKLYAELGTTAAKVLTTEGGLSVDVNAVMRKVPKLSAETYIDTFLERISHRFRGKTINGAWRVVLANFYTATPNERAAKLASIHELLTRDFGPEAVALFDSIPASGRAQKIDFLRRELIPLGLSLRDSQVEAIADYFDAANRFDPPFLKGLRERLDPERAEDGHFGWDIGQQGAENATRLQEHLGKAHNLRGALHLAADSEKVATKTLEKLLAIPKEAASETGMLESGKDGGSYTGSGDDGSLASAKGKSKTEDARNAYYRRIVDKTESAFPGEDLLHRLRGAFNPGRGDSRLVSLGHGIEKKVRAQLSKTQDFDNMKRVMMLVEVSENEAGEKSIDLVITPGKDAKVNPRLLSEAEKAAKAHLPEGWVFGKIRVVPPAPKPSSLSVPSQRWADFPLRLAA